MFKNLDTATLRREVAGEVKARTSAFAEKHGYTKVAEAAPAKPKVSERVGKLNDLLATGTFGCQSSSVAKALSIVLGEEVTYAAESRRDSTPRVDPFPFGIAVVTVDSKAWNSPWGYDKTLMNGEYPTNPSYFTDGKQQGQASGRKANTRPATAKEIDTLMASLSDKTVIAIAVNMLASTSAEAAK